jgi:chromosome segregation ATPase
LVTTETRDTWDVLDTRAAGILEAADELQRRDDVVAAEIAELDGLAAGVASTRARAIDVRAGLASVPLEATALEGSIEDAKAREGEAHAELADAERRLAGLEASRRRKPEEIAQARRRATNAREVLTDARHRVERLLARRLELRAQERELQAEAESLLGEARALARRIGGAPRVPEAGKGIPGASLDELDEWGGRARAALFVARGTAETERERVVNEAAALLGSVLGDAPAGASVALARRRLEEALAG